MFNAIKIADNKFNNLSDMEKIKFGVNLLVDKKIVKTSLFNEIKKSIEKYGPYFVFDNGVAVSHAPPSVSSLNIGVSLVSSKKGFYLYNKKINLLFTLSVPEGGDHIALLQKVILAVKDERERERILNLKEK